MRRNNVYVTIEILKDLNRSIKHQTKINDSIVDMIAELNKRVSVVEQTLKMMKEQR